MPANSALASTPAPKGLTGWHVLAWLFLFFGATFTANGFLIYHALQSFSGLEVQSAYSAGNAFQSEVDAANAQAALGWTVDVSIRRAADGSARIEASPKDSSGAALIGLTLNVQFQRPADRRQDLSVTLSDDLGTYRGVLASVSPGQWEVVIEASRSGIRLYRSRNRTVLD